MSNNNYTLLSSNNNNKNSNNPWKFPNFIPKKYENFKPLIHLFFGLILLIIGVIGGEMWMKCDYVKMGPPPSPMWEQQPGGYEEYNFYGLILQNFCLPLSFYNFIIFYYLFYKSIYYNYIYKLILYLILLIGWIICVFITIINYTDGILSCFIVFCIDKKFEDTTAPYMITTALYYIIISIVFIIISLILSARVLYYMIFERYFPDTLNTGSFMEINNNNNIENINNNNNNNNNEIKNDDLFDNELYGDNNNPLISPEKNKDSIYNNHNINEENIINNDSIPTLFSDIDNHNKDIEIALIRSKSESNLKKRLKKENLKNDYILNNTIKRKKYKLIISFVFLILYPFIIFLCMSLPDSWEFFNTINIVTNQQTEITQEYGKVWNWKISNDLILHLFPDILAYYSFIYLIMIIGILSQYSYKLSCFLKKRPFYNIFKGFSIGELLLIFLFFSLLISEFCYWYLTHGYHSEPKSNKSHEERITRTIGQLANITMSCMLLSVSRNSIWSIIFGISWEKMISFHRYMGYLFLILIITHIGLWWKVYDQQGTFPEDIFQIPLTFNSDNFTTNLSFITTLGTFIFMGILSLDKIRRQFFELFYYAHHYAYIVLIVMLWHAHSAWYYLLGSLILLAYDRALRFTYSCSNVILTDINSIKTINNENYIKLSYLIESGGNGPWTSIPTSLEHTLGQYCFINIPNISTYEWHPFSIFSSPDNFTTTHYIKDMGNGTWTNQLRLLIQQNEQILNNNNNNNSINNDYDKNGLLNYEKNNFNFTINIDGPYGFPINIQRYTSILFIAGGIGITPINCYMESFYHMQQLNCLPNNLETIRLVWIMRSIKLLNIIKPLIENILDNNYSNKFKIKIYITHDTNDIILNEFEESLSILMENYDLKKETDKFIIYNSNNNNEIHIISNRPNLKNIIIPYKGYNMECLCFTCGPQSIVNECSLITSDLNLDFHHETFLL